MPNNYVLLDRIELNTTVASVTFDNIPQTGYTDLKIVISARDTSSSDAKGSYYTIAFNGGSSYAGRYLQGNGSSVGSGTLGQLAGIADTSASTASTFSNDEIYIPNYTSTSAKSYSVDSVTESNATGAYATLVAGSWSGGAVTTITLTPSVGSFVANSTFSLYGLAAVGTTPVTAPKADGGNVIGTDGTYWYHAFLSNGTFTPQVNLTADVLVVAGGAGGGYWTGGGGGAGGLLNFTSQALTTATAVTVGAGGAGGTSGTAKGTNGVNSQFGALTAAIGGGAGGGYNGSYVSPNTGGSGGGNTSQAASGATGTSGQGNSGGAGVGAPYYNGGGGGGAGSVGTAAAATGGSGGSGVNTYSSWATATATGVSGFYAGGGGGGANSSTAGNGTNGGGNGSATGASVGGSGTTNTGSGGGGGGWDPSNSGGNGGAGGSGIIIIRYLVA